MGKRTKITEKVNEAEAVLAEIEAIPELSKEQQVGPRQRAGRPVDKLPAGAFRTVRGGVVMPFPEKLREEIRERAEKLRCPDGQHGGAVSATPPAGRFGVISAAAYCKDPACRAPILLAGTHAWVPLNAKPGHDIYCVACASSSSEKVAVAWNRLRGELLSRFGEKEVVRVITGKPDNRRGVPGEYVSPRARPRGDVPAAAE